MKGEPLLKGILGPPEELVNAPMHTRRAKTLPFWEGEVSHQFCRFVISDNFLAVLDERHWGFFPFPGQLLNLF